MSIVKIKFRPWLVCILVLAALSVQAEDRKRSRTSSSLEVAPTSVSMSVGSTAILTVSNAYGSVSVESGEKSVVGVRYREGFATLTGYKAGSTTVTVRDRVSSREIPVTVVKTAPPPPPTADGDYALLAWNDLGMHCVDGKDYSIFSVLPPYNNLNAHLINKNGGLVTEGVEITYEAIKDTRGSINTSSSDKTNFWEYVLALFGSEPADDYGLNLSGDPGNPTPSLIPAPMQYNPEFGWFEAVGIPITPLSDEFLEDDPEVHVKNFYPMVKVVAKDLSGKMLATTETVLPVSDEMTCKACHSSNSNDAAKPEGGWVNDSDPEKEWKQNILALHDDEHANQDLYNNAVEAFYGAALDDLKAKGINDNGLLQIAKNGQPILCASCHGSNALNSPGFPDVKPLTQALHSNHATVVDPETSMTLDDSENRSSCYLCHPGAVTQCLRGAMGNAKDDAGELAMSCQSCHGNMSQVGSEERQGWFEEPTCQSCHHDGQRDLSVFDESGQQKKPADTTFASNPDTPALGLDLYRFSKGHGDLQCESCHGPTHAIYPSHEDNDNVQSIAVQGHVGTVNECEACHTQVPLTLNGGPHGMHTIGNAWIKEHEEYAEQGGSEACTYCHGADYRGSPLSEIKVGKTFRVEEDTKSFAAGHQVGCYDCHNGPNP